MLKGLKIIFVGCMAIGAASFAYRMIDVQDVQADGQKVQTDAQASAPQKVEEQVKQESTEPNQPTMNHSPLKEVSAEKAKEIALGHINGKFIKIVTDEDDYHVYIEKDGYKYEVEVDLYKGVVDDIDKEKIKANQGITEEKAKQLALAKVNGKIVDIKSDDDDYNIYIEKDNYIYEIEVDRYRGVVDDIDKEKKPTPRTRKISIEKAKEIALTKVNGTLKEVDYDNDDNEYEVTVVKD